ncbi:hypothetical protein HpSP79_12440 [Helicobacter pylori]
MHETMVRLYQAAKELKGIDGRGAQSEIARLFGASPQQIKNWERRGISNRGMIDASKILGISASWLKTGQGDIRDIQPYSLERLDIYMDTLQERLIHARKQKQMSQAQLGKAIGKSQSAIAALETGRNKASTDIAKIANALGVSAIWLETGQGEMRETYQLPTKGDVRDIHEPRLWSSNTPLPEDEYSFVPYLKEVKFSC